MAEDMIMDCTHPECPNKPAQAATAGARFAAAYERMIRNEGGYTLHKVDGDRGGQTYAGIARNSWPTWTGWREIDAGREPSAELVRLFYRANFWQPVRGDDYADERVARTIFDFAVNAGTKTAAVLAQTVAGTTPDGKIGPKTIEAINATHPDLFMARFALAKVARYAQIVNKDRTQAKFLLGWINRTLKEA